MPLILAGFAWLARFFASFGGTAAFLFAKYVTKRLVIIAAALNAAVIATVLFYAAIQAIIDSILPATPSWLSLASVLFLPNNVHACMTAIGAAHAARLVYVWRYRAIFAKANVSFGG